MEGYEQEDLFSDLPEHENIRGNITAIDNLENSPP